MRIADIYQFCWGYAKNPQSFAQDLQLKGRLRSDLSDNFQSLLNRFSMQCGNFVGQNIGPSTVAMMRQQAAKSGNLEAQVQELATPLLTGSAPVAALDSLAQKIISSGDARAMEAIAPLMGAISDTGKGASINYPIGSDLAEAAWRIAACRLGNECGPQSRTVAQMCIYGGTNCAMRSLEEFYRNEVLPPSDSARLGQLVNQLAQRKE